MSAALQIPLQAPMIWGSATTQPLWPAQNGRQDEALPEVTKRNVAEDADEDEQDAGPSICLAFYRKYTESTLRRYLYASMQVGRTPSVLGNAVGRGYASSRRVRTFEDAVIFVLDMESCLRRLGALDRALLSRIVIQEYTQAETAEMLGMSLRAVNYKLRHALDRMTELLLDSELLELPH